MAGGQERVLRRRIRSVQRRRNHEGHGAHRRVPDLASQNRISANRPYRAGWPASWSRRLRRPGGGAKLLGTPEQVNSWWSSPSVADRGLSGAYNPVLRATSASSTVTAGGGHRRLFSVGKKAQGYLRFRGYEVERSFIGSATARVLRRPGRRSVAAARSWRRGRPGPARVHPLHSAGTRASPPSSSCRCPTPTRGVRGGDESPNQEKPASRATPNSSPS